MMNLKLYTFQRELSFGSIMDDCIFDTQKVVTTSSTCMNLLTNQRQAF